MRNQARFAFGLPTSKTAHGGSLSIGRRKKVRPFIPRRPMHLVLKSEKARGKLSLLQPENDREVRRILKKAAERHFVRLFDVVNVGNHLHLKIRANERACLQGFLRSVTALIARAVTGARRGLSFGKFWKVGSSRVDLQACKLEYSIVSPK